MIDKCEQHESDGIITETIVSDGGYPFDVRHCKRCGRRMVKPVSPRKEPERFRELAGAEAVNRAEMLRYLPER